MPESLIGWYLACLPWLWLSFGLPETKIQSPLRVKAFNPIFSKSDKSYVFWRQTGTNASPDQPIKDSSIGWVVDHFPYHLTLLKRELHRSLV